MSSASDWAFHFTQKAAQLVRRSPSTAGPPYTHPVHGIKLIWNIYIFIVRGITGARMKNETGFFLKTNRIQYFETSKRPKKRIRCTYRCVVCVYRFSLIYIFSCALQERHIYLIKEIQLLFTSVCPQICLFV